MKIMPLALMFLSGCATLLPQGPAPAPLPAEPPGHPSDRGDYVMKLNPGDLVEITVFQDKDLSGEYTVAEDGTLVFPLVGKVRVAGLSPAQAAGAIEERLRQGFIRSPVVNVLVKEHNAEKVYVFGKVKKPGNFEYSSGMTIVEAITLAGGLSDIANSRRVYVTRNAQGRDRRIVVDLQGILDGTSPMYVLEPGDIVYVPESVF